MIEQHAQVLSVDGGKATVRVGAGSGCAACAAGKGCGAGIFGRLLQRQPVLVDVENQVGAAAGQTVMVGIPERLFLRLAVRFYLVPLLFGLGGMAIGNYLSLLSHSGPEVVDAVALGSGLLAAAAAFSYLRGTLPEFPGVPVVHLLRVVGKDDLNYQE